MNSFVNLQSLLQSAGFNEPIDSTVKPTKPKRFLLVSTHAQQTTGYSKVSHNLVSEFAKLPDIQIFHFGFQRFHEIGETYRPYPANVDVYDPVKHEQENSVPKESGFGYSQLPDYVRKVKPDVILIYNDAAVICEFLNKLRDKLQPSERTYKMILYLDQVYTLQRPDLLKRMEEDATVFFAFTNYWRDILKKQGITKPIHILRHGFDASTYVPLDRATLRKKHNIPENVFLMLNLNRNTPRKRYDLVVTALAELVARYPTKPIALLCVCDAGENGGFPIHEIYTRELIKRGVSVDQHFNKLLITKSALSYTDDIINEMYNMSDIGVTATEGEGFGLCHFEAMGVGVPQVVPDIGGFKDFCNSDNAVLVKPTQEYYLPYAFSILGGQIELVNPSDLCLGIEEYLLDSELRKKHGANARNTILQYKWSDEIKELADVIRSL
jgi:glycosyltransferase involved in cell wall biosynthesis